MKVLVPLPSTDFDPSESAVPWSVLRDAGHEVLFATPDGKAGAADDRVLTGRGFGPWRPFLKARGEVCALYQRMERDDRFRSPLRYDQLGAGEFDGIVLPGGHAPGMKPYLESLELQRLVRAHMAADKPIGAICHGVLLVARTLDEAGASVLRGRRTTALTRAMEMTAWGMTCAWLGSYYRTYPEPVQDEVTRAVGAAGEFREGPFAVLRDGPNHLARGFTVRDGRYLSARWPGDAYSFAHGFAALLGS